MRQFHFLGNPVRESYFEQPMPNESSIKSIKSPAEKLSATQLERLCNEAEQLIFNNFEGARSRFEKVAAQISKSTSAEIRLKFLLGMAFLENQENRYWEAIVFQEKAILILEKTGQTHFLADALTDLSALHANLRNFEISENALRRAEKLLDVADLPALRGRLATRDGFLKLQIGQIREALERFLEAERLLLGLGETAEKKDFYFLSLNYSGLGELYNRLNEKEKSVLAYLQALKVSENQDLRPRLGHLFLNCGRALLANDKAADAQFYFENALRHAGPGDLNLKTHGQINLGIVAFLKSDFDKAFQFYSEGLLFYQNPSNPQDFNNLSILESLLTQLFLETEQVELAEEHFQKALDWAVKCDDFQNLLAVCTTIAEVQAQQNDFQSAYKYQLLAGEIDRRIAEKSKEIEIRDIETRYELEKRRQEAREAKLRLTGLQLRALRAQMNPHFLFNALNAIQGQITSGRLDAAETHLAKFAKLMRRTLDYSDWEVVSLETEISFLENYLDLNQKLRFAGKMTCKIFVHPDLETEDVSIPTMIVQPFVENAIEHGLRPMSGGDLTVKFTLIEAENMVLCTIEDNGEGYNRSREKKLTDPSFSIHKSKGMEITRERLDLLHQQQGQNAGKWVKILDLEEISGGQKRGTRVEVLMPIL